jgi:hypothetical protein
MRFGPAPNPQWRIVQSTAGIEAVRLGTAPTPPRVTDWEARWVWLDPAHFPAAQTAPVGWWSDDAHRVGTVAVAGLLRGVFHLASVPAPVWLRISADSRYRLWINGQFTGRGPAAVGGSYAKRAAPDWWYYDTLEVAAFLKAGRNLVAVEVVAGPDNQTCFSQGHAGFAAELVDGGGRVLSAADSGWRGVAFMGYRVGQWTGLTRNCDLRAYPGGWETEGLDDAQWPALVRDTTPRPRARRHGLPALMETRVGPLADTPVTIAPGSEPAGVRFEFERMLAGHIQLVFTATAGTVVEIGFEELPGRREGGARCLRLVLPEGETRYESWAYFSARAVYVTAAFPAGAGPLTIREPAMLARSQPLTYRGAFECSDGFLNELWLTCRWTAQLCLQEIHLDSPHHQEPLGDHGDYLVEMLMGYYAFGDYALAHADLRRMALDLEQQDGAQFHTSYAMLMPDLAADLLLFTGDRAAAREVLPSIRRVLRRLLVWRGPEGLLSQAPNYMFVDWIEHAGVNYHHPPAAQGMGALTAFAVRALRRAAWLSREVGGPAEEAERWEQQADEMAAAFRLQLFDAARGIFRDGLCGINRQQTGRWLPADPPAPVYTRHTNILAVWAGIVSGTEAVAVIERVLDDPALPEPQPYFQHYLFEALALAGIFSERSRAQLDLWRPMLSAPTGTLREMWTGGDHSHAWGGTPLVQMSGRILGVEPAAPGWRSVRLCPHTLDLAWARGTVPTPLGDIQVAWERQESFVHLRVFAPAGIGVDVPDGCELDPDGHWRRFRLALPRRNSAKAEFIREE